MEIRDSTLKPHFRGRKMGFECTVPSFVRSFGVVRHSWTEMARIARVVAKGVPHHVTQRGNGRQIVFDDPQDHRIYLKLLKRYAEEHSLRVWAWCLMSNHIHLLAVPETGRSLVRTLGRTHAEYARYRNARLASCGHIWQARYYSCPVDAWSVWDVIAYIERNPVRAGMVGSAEDYQWSSARAHISGQDDSGWLDMSRWREHYTGARWRDALRVGVNEEALGERIRVATRTGRPLGSAEFIEGLERAANRQLRPRSVGRPRKEGLIEIGV
jgi:putative transposase